MNGKILEFDLKELKYQRQRRNLTQEDMAKAMGLSASSYNQKENGNVNITMEELNLILKILNISDVNIFFKIKSPNVNHKSKC